jgi:hypothetical protein
LSNSVQRSDSKRQLPYAVEMTLNASGTLIDDAGL